jgi:hypothetical protein
VPTASPECPGRSRLPGLLGAGSAGVALPSLSDLAAGVIWERRLRWGLPSGTSMMQGAPSPHGLHDEQPSTAHDPDRPHWHWQMPNRQRPGPPD